MNVQVLLRNFLKNLERETNNMERCPSWLRGTPGKRVRPKGPAGSSPALSASKKFIKFVVLDGEVAVPCNLQSAIAGSNSYLRHFVLGSALNKW